jgi:hypothetical protein
MPIGDGIRRNVATISQEERNKLRDAFIELNRRFYPGNRNDIPAGGVSYWFKQDEIHQATHIHSFQGRGIVFLPWHRELCNRLEALLREVDSVLSLHYWDWNTDPQNSPDGAGGSVNLFTPDFMGAASGTEAGEPWLSEGFYDPNANPPRGEFEGDPSGSGNPVDPPRSLIRSVGAGVPARTWSDDEIVEVETFPEMRGRLENSHDLTHNYIGGTIGNPHTSFRDPFVFLLHSNVDRLFALWQLQRGKEWRLDPEQVYGTESSTDILPSPVYDPGILTPLDPWAGNPNNHPEVHRIRPWATPENEHLRPENRKNSKHPSVVAPPAYDTNPVQPSVPSGALSLLLEQDEDISGALSALLG